MYLIGVWKCNSELIYDSTAEISHLFFSRHHPIYQNILYYKTLDLILMPNELRVIMEKYISGSRTMIVKKCQGGDALLEEINKESKSWLKIAEIPLEEHWLRVFWNLDELSKVRFFMYINIYCLYKYSFQRRIQNNVKYLQWRFLWKQSKVLAITYFRKKFHLRCLTGFCIHRCVFLLLWRLAKLYVVLPDKYTLEYICDWKKVNSVFHIKIM